MTLWRPPVRSEAPLSGVWRALGRHNYGCDHYLDPARGWVLVVDRLERRQGEWFKERYGEWVADDEIDVIVKALSSLPGIGLRLALMEMLL
jgi:hypothetical protein